MALITPVRNKIYMNEDAMVVILSKIWPFVTPLEVVTTSDGISTTPLMAGLVIAFLGLLVDIQLSVTLILVMFMYLLLAFCTFNGIVFKRISHFFGVISVFIMEICMVYLTYLFVLVIYMNSISVLFKVTPLLLLVTLFHCEKYFKEIYIKHMAGLTGHKIPAYDMAFILACQHYAQILGVTDCLNTRTVCTKSIKEVKQYFEENLMNENDYEAGV